MPLHFQTLLGDTFRQPELMNVQPCNSNTPYSTITQYDEIKISKLIHNTHVPYWAQNDMIAPVQEQQYVKPPAWAHKTPNKVVHVSEVPPLPAAAPFVFPKIDFDAYRNIIEVKDKLPSIFKFYT